MFFLRLQSQDEIRIVDLIDNSSGYPAALNRLFEPVAVHGIREDTEPLPSGLPWEHVALRLFLVLEYHRRSWDFSLAYLEPTVSTAYSQFWLQQPATQETIHDFGHIVMHSEAVTFLNFDEHIKRRRCLALQDGLLGTASPGLLVRQGDGLNPTHEVGEGRIPQQVVEGIPMGCGNELDATLSNGASRQRFSFGADLIDDDHLGHVVFHGLDHHSVLLRGRRHLHTPRPADTGVWDVAITGDLVRGVHDNEPFAQVVC